MIRAASARDAASIAAIYNHYVENTTVTFEEEPFSAAVIAERIAEVTRTHPWLIHEEKGEVRGYAYGSPWRPRASYRHSAESTIYLSHSCTGSGVGTALYRELLSSLAKIELHCVVGVIALPNPASVALHEKLGFQKVGHLEQIGRKFDTWIDVAHWQLLL